MAQYMDYGIQGKAAIVTGAGTGIGRSCAVELAKGGASVALFGRRTLVLEEALSECLKYTDKALALSVDVSDQESVKTGVGKVLEAFEKWIYSSTTPALKRGISRASRFSAITSTS